MRKAIIVVGLLSLASCRKKTAWYTTNVEIDRIEVVRRDAQGKALDVDVEFTYPDCPGEQMEIIRGDANFAACIANYSKGATVPVKILHHQDKQGFYDWDIHQMADCARLPDDDDEASFDTVQECSPILVNQVPEGFVCNRIPHKELLAKCPWFDRR